MISTADLTQLPDIASLRRICQALAALDAVLSPDWEMRYYSFNSAWGPGEMMASMRDGSGDQWFSLFCDAGVALVGLAHESETFTQGSPKPWVYASLPPVFKKNVREEGAFEPDDVTFCIWRLDGDAAWSCGAPPGCRDGSEELLSILDGDPSSYVAFAREYYERDVPLEAVKAIYAHELLTPELASALNPEVSLEDLEADLREIGYPLSTA